MTYIQVKAGPGEETNVETALREEFIRRGGPGADGGSNNVTIPVKYDYQELWRWQLILNRFALSSGNTIGITGAVVSDNRDWYDEAVSPWSSLTVADGDAYSDFRETVHVWALDAQRVAKALPTLLPLLGIPVDAVGVIGRFSSKPVPLVEPEPLSVNSGIDKKLDALTIESQRVSTWIFAGGGAIIGLILLGTVLGCPWDYVEGVHSPVQGQPGWFHLIISHRPSCWRRLRRRFRKPMPKNRIQTRRHPAVIVTSAMFLTGVMGRRRA